MPNANTCFVKAHAFKTYQILRNAHIADRKRKLIKNNLTILEESPETNLKKSALNVRMNLVLSFKNLSDLKIILITKKAINVIKLSRAH
jgi:hypothetical protein